MRKALRMVERSSSGTYLRGGGWCGVARRGEGGARPRARAAPLRPRAAPLLRPRPGRLPPLPPARLPHLARMAIMEGQNMPMQTSKTQKASIWARCSPL
jgi:hypothetical protein